MSIYRRKYWVTKKDGTREQRTQPWFTVELIHPTTGKVIRKRGFRDRKASQQLEADLRRDLERGAVGLIDIYAPHKATPFQKHIDDFIQWLEAKGLDASEGGYIYTARKRLERIALEAGWFRLEDATYPSFEKWRVKTAKSGWKGRPTKPKTLNQFLAILNEFFKWCVKNTRIQSNPMEVADKAKEVPNDTYRRAATEDEMTRFLAALPNDELRRFYIFLAYTALRRSTIESLRWRNLDLSETDPHVTVESANNKNRKPQRFALRSDVAKMMADAKAALAIGGTKDIDNKLVFPTVPTIEAHKEYLTLADVKFDEDGQRRLDIHAFRKTLHTWMENAGVDVREASKALGHLHLSTTMKNYREKRHARREASVELLPALPLPKSARKADDAPTQTGGNPPERLEKNG